MYGKNLKILTRCPLSVVFGVSVTSYLAGKVIKVRKTPHFLCFLGELSEKNAPFLPENYGNSPVDVISKSTPFP